MARYRTGFITSVVLVCAAMGAFTDRALSDNILVNPGFEAGDFTGWDVFSCCPPDGSLFFVSGSVPHTGSFLAEFDGPGSPDDPENFSLEQTFAPIPTERIAEVSFWAFRNNTAPIFFSQFRMRYTDGTFSAMNVTGPANVWTKLDFTSLLDPGKLLSEIQLLGGGGIGLPANEGYDDFVVDVIPPAGACCFEGACLDGMTEANCLTVGGTFLGGDSVCAAGSCSNDDCADAIPIGEGDTPYSTLEATTDGPGLPAECQEGANPLDFGNDIWFTFLPAASGTLTVSTCDQADYDSRLAAYTGDCGALELIACNDDGSGCAGFSSLMEVPVTCGVPVRLRVGGFGVNAGTGTLTLSLAACPEDLNGNGEVDFGDLVQLLSKWGPCP